MCNTIGCPNLDSPPLCAMCTYDIATLKAELATSKKVIEVLAGTTASRLRPKEWWIEWAEERVKTESHAVMHSAEEIDKIFSQF